MKFDSFQHGNTYYYTYSERMGNTTIRTTRVQSVKVLDMDTVNQTLRVLINGREWTYKERDWKKLRKSKPMLIGSITGRQRLATRAEIKAAAAKVACTDA